MPINGFFLQILTGTLITLKLASSAAVIGICLGLILSALEAITIQWIRFLVSSIIFIIRGLPELLVLFFIYFGTTAILTNLLGHYVEISSFVAGLTALSLIFAVYASQVFRGAFLAIDYGQIEAGKALGLTALQIFLYIKIPQAWRHAIPGLGNLWLVLLKDTSIVMLIGLTDLMGQAKIAASTTHQPFTFFLFAAGIYLLITVVSQKMIQYVSVKANKHITVHG